MKNKFILTKKFAGILHSKENFQIKNLSQRWLHKIKTSAQPEKRHFKMKDFFHNKIKKTAVATGLRQGFSLFCFGKKIHFKRRLAVVQRSQIQ